MQDDGERRVREAHGCRAEENLHEEEDGDHDRSSGVTNGERRRCRHATAIERDDERRNR